LGLSVTCVGRLEVSARGAVLELVGSDPATLAEVLSALAAARLDQTDGVIEVARSYAKDGVGARDPRTGATLVRLKDALGGELDVFLEAWRSHATRAVTRPSGFART
jgi:hypothetical protein